MKNSWNYCFGDIVLGWNDEGNARSFLIMGKRTILFGFAVEFKLIDLFDDNECKVYCKYADNISCNICKFKGYKKLPNQQYSIAIYDDSENYKLLDKNVGE